MAHSGTCFCGAVRLAISAGPLGARLCWCRDCQKIACGSAALNVLFDEAAVQVSGPVAHVMKVAASGNRIARGFCPQCGTNLYARTVEGPPAPMRVRAGALDDPGICAPGSVVWAASAPSWAHFPPAVPVFAAGPGSAELRPGPASA